MVAEGCFPRPTEVSAALHSSVLLYTNVKQHTGHTNVKQHTLAQEFVSVRRRLEGNGGLSCFTLKCVALHECTATHGLHECKATRNVKQHTPHTNVKQHRV